MIFEKAYAKINLTLNITGRREDGYHTLDTVMQTVSLYDTVKVEKSDVITVSCGKLSGRENIAYKAAEAFFNAAGINGGADISIRKSIPVCGGFGGGSADAAAVLRALNKLYKTGFSDEVLRKIALALGADVPFLIGGGTCLCTGIGEILQPVKPADGVFYCVCAAGSGASTRKMFAEIDKHNISGCDSEKMIKSLADGNISGIASCLHNDFENVCRAFCPRVTETEARLLELGALGASLTGSGNGVFGVFDSQEKAEAAAKEIGKSAFARAAVNVN